MYSLLFQPLSAWGKKGKISCPHQESNLKHSACSLISILSYPTLYAISIFLQHVFKWKMITQILYFIHGHNRSEPFSNVTVTSDPVYSTTHNQGLSGGQIFRTINQEKSQNGAASILNRKLLIWLQKYYIHHKFKPNYVFLESTLPKERKKTD
jgi:hypothetical protein